MALQVATAAINALRDNHYVLNTVSGLNERSVLMEGSRTNNWYAFSNDFTNAAWTKNNASIIASATTGPDGVAASASKLVESVAVTTTHSSFRTITGATDSTAQTASIHVKAGERSILAFSFTRKDATNLSAWFNVGTGAWGTVNSGITAHPPVALANGWYRVSATLTNVGVGATTPACDFRIALVDSATAYTGDGTSGLYLSEAQAEVDQAFPSSHIPSSFASGTRGADSYSVPFTTPPQAMTLYSKFVERGTISTSGSSRVLAIGSGNPRLIIISTGAFYQLFQHNGTASVTSTQAVAPAIGNTVELRAILNADGSVQLGQSINGAAEVLATASAANALPAAWSLATLYLNAEAGASVGFNAFLVPYKVALGVKTLTEMRNL